MTKTRLVAALAVLVVLVIAAGVAFHQHREDERVAAATYAAAAAGRAVGATTVPATFTPVTCTGGQRDYDRCWRAALPADDAVAALQEALAEQGIDRLVVDCPSSPRYRGESLGCTLTGSTVVAVATRDLRTTVADGGELLAGTSSVAVASAPFVGE
ncbi:hypothetical protein IC607_16565 [Cellulomonas sp. JH27-2]|uniref:hypothetical protein n=1 Tax=Cellulomonas sp. JH27-2 TaxID=2774139 RepID=UPI00177F7A58|nr:hypothetical protein [Cellulomonas sp. JH27-2]MBD8060582.1 hypothetical protein [Cellulomonas sp. JH27-2]